MKLEDIGFYTLSNDRVKNSSQYSLLWRCELLLTNKCNFKCPYCRGLNGKDITFYDAKKILNLWFAEGLKNVRFSGGEPTLYNKLFELITLCKNNNVEHIAVSTNGSNNYDYYKKLIELGVNDFSISLDACCSSTGDLMSGTSGIWNKVIKNIGLLSKYTYVTVGIVYNEKNETELINILELAHNLGVSDMRIIASAQYNKKFNKKFVPSFTKKYPILKYRLNLNRPVRGLNKNDSYKCKLVLDDMAVWNDFHYPCIIYLRESGNPIGKISNNMRKERYDWYINHNSLNDNICKSNCLDVCRDYNNKASLND